MSSPQTYIAHLDLDSFFVSVEIINNPSLKGKPVIVGGHNERGVVAACSYEARKYGVHSAMSMKKALQLCPNAIIISGTRSEYTQFSRKVTNIIASKAPLFEKASIDEFYVDLTGMDKYFDPFQWTINLRNEIIQQTQLPISFGLASNKMVAKIATDEAKPNGYLWVYPGMEKDFLAPLAVNKIPGVGKQTFLLLQNMGIAFIGDILKFTSQELEQQLGNFGLELYQKAQGIHWGKVYPYHEVKSVSTENTFEENTNNINFLLSELVRMTEKIAHELRKENKLCKCVAVKIRYPNFETTSRQITINDTCRDDELIAVAKSLFHQLYRKNMPVRLLGIRLSELTYSAIQANLFDDGTKKANLYKAIDAVKNQYGKKSLQTARSVYQKNNKAN